MSTAKANAVEELESGIRVADPIRADDDHRNDEIVDDQVATPIAAVEVQPRLTKTSEDVVLLEKQHVNDQGEPIDVARAEQDRNLTSESDLSDTNRKIWVVTTAAMPWRTGTSLNPLMRALYLTRGRPKHSITLVIPWLEDIKSRKKLYGDALCFDDGGKQAQEQWIREYCRERCKCEEEEQNLRIMFWRGRYHDGFGSIFPVEDICSLIPKKEADVAILEEPEHLNWFRLPTKVGKNEENQDVDRLGWAHKFKHVVGVLHTNYGAYIRQYGMGTSFVTAPALDALSSLVVRAYCHRLVRLSATLPSLDSDIEVTSNVHGVRSEFLSPPQRKSETTKPHAPVYFVGKLIWAKGFDKVLEVQEAYHEVAGEYFAMDIYGGGDDMKAIQRGFFGRHKSNSNRSDDSSDSLSQIESTDSMDDSQAADVFGKEKYKSDDEANSEISGEEDILEGADDNAPLDILGDVSGKALSTGAETASAAMKMIESIMSAGFGAFGGGSESNSENKSTDEIGSKRSRSNVPSFMFGPARSRFKWRRTPIPARFLGVEDHIVVRDIPDHKIFLNMSITEVLCTTSAEALAMGKFVILPKHSSNEFFYCFPNCLAFEDMDDCVRKIQYALTNKPEPLTDKFVRMLSWEGATDRLYDSSGMTRDEADKLKEAGRVEKREKAARFHVDSAQKSHFVTSLLSGKMLKKALSSHSFN